MGQFTFSISSIKRKPTKIMASHYWSGPLLIAKWPQGSTGHVSFTTLNILPLVEWHQQGKDVWQRKNKVWAKEVSPAHQLPFANLYNIRTMLTKPSNLFTSTFLLVLILILVVSPSLASQSCLSTYPPGCHWHIRDDGQVWKWVIGFKGDFGRVFEVSSSTLLI